MRGIMAYSGQARRFRGSKKRVARIRLTARDKWFVVLLALICLLATIAAGWLCMNYEE
jgi:hypothetical protein